MRMRSLPIKASSLYDKEIYTSDARFVGVVDELIFDTAQGKISALEIVTRDGRKVNVPFHLVAHVKDIIILKSVGR